jgi:transposase
MGDRDLTDEQWGLLSGLLPPLPRRKDGRGRPWKDSRAVLNGILWVLRTGAQWNEMPGRYPPYQTCHRRYQRWVRQGAWQKIVQALAERLRQRGELDLAEAFIDAMFAPAKKGAMRSAKPSGARVRR